LSHTLNSSPPAHLVDAGKLVHLPLRFGTDLFAVGVDQVGRVVVRVYIRRLAEVAHVFLQQLLRPLLAEDRIGGGPTGRGPASGSAPRRRRGPWPGRARAR
jgi:hypothetical protein